MTDAPERHNDTERNKALNLAVTELDVIINQHDPEIDAPINDGVWNAIDRLCDGLEKRAFAAGIEAAAKSPTPQAPVTVPVAAMVLANMVENRKWPCYPIEMPLTRDGRGPATLGVDASTMSYEVWDAVSLRALSDHEKLPDAIESWLRALSQQEQQT